VHGFVALAFVNDVTNDVYNVASTVVVDYVAGDDVVKDVLSEASKNSFVDMDVAVVQKVAGLS